MRADSAVEPTKSENITVTWRRSAVSLGAGSGAVGADASALRDSRGWRSTKLSDCSQHSPAMPERYAEPIKVLIRQFTENVDIYVALGKALRVLGHAEFFEPLRNLLHCAASLLGSLRRTSRRYPRNAPS